MARKKASTRKKAKTERTPRRRCSRDKCRKLRLDDSFFCRDHQDPVKGNGAEDPNEKIVKLTERDALRFGKADAEIRNAIQGQQLIDFEIADIKRSTAAKIKELQMKKLQLVATVKSYEGNYRGLINEIAESYGIPDPTKMVIDPDSGTVRDLRQV